MRTDRLLTIALFLLICHATQLQAALLLDTASGTPQPSRISLAVRDGIWPMHRFEVTTPGFDVTSVGGFFEEFNENSDVTVFAAIVSLTGPTDIPDSFDLTTGDLVATTTFVVPEDALQPVSTSFPLSLTTGWYALVFGTGAFGADTVGSDAFDGVLLTGLPTDLDLSQQPVSLFNSANNGPQNTFLDQDVNADFVVEGNFVGVPEPGSMLLLGLCGLGTSLVAARRRRTQQAA